MRQAKHLTQDALAERAGLTAKYLSEVENGHVNPSLKVLHALANEGLGVTISELFGGPLSVAATRPDVAKIVSLLEPETDEVCATVARIVEAVVGPLSSHGSRPSERR